MTDINVEINVTGAPIDIGTIAVGSYSDMQKGVYDTNNSGVVDDAEKVNGLTVETAVPSGAVFTDTIYDDTPVTEHIADEDNPHATTKTHVGLPLADNTSDATKPVSTPQQTALDLKVDITDIVDDLITGGSAVPLSAEQGKSLKLELTENKYTSSDNEGQVIPLHASAIEGNLNVTLQGKTYANIVENGDFEDGTTGWAGNFSTISIVDSKLRIDKDTRIDVIQYYDFTIGKYYINIGYVDTDMSDFYVYILNNGFVRLDTSDFNTIFDVTVIGSSFDLGRAVYNDGTYAIIDNVNIVNLTAIGETETDLDILAAKYPYVDGTKSVSPQKVQCVGKNLFDKELELGRYSITTGEKTVNVLSARSDDYVKTIPNTEYYSSNFGTLLSRVTLFYDAEKNFISYVTTFNFTTPANAHYLTFYTAQSNDLTTLHQLELGSSATTYEPYKETHLYTTDELSGLPNGTRDEVNLLSGGKVQRVKEYVVTADDVTAFDNTIYTNDFASIAKTNFSDIDDFNDAIDDFIMLANLSQMNNTAANFNDTSKAGMYATIASVQTVAISSLAGTYADLAAAKAGLTGTVIYYETTEPITTQLPPQLLKSEKSGTLYVEQKIEDFGFYGSNFVILDTGYPITTLTEVVKVDTQTGEEITLDIGNCTIAGDGLSFTSTDLTSDDFVRCEFEYTPAGAPPTVDYIVSTTLKGQVNDNSDGVKYLNKKVVSLELKVDAPINTISGTFTTTDAKTVTVTNGVITNII